MLGGLHDNFKNFMNACCFLQPMLMVGLITLCGSRVTAAHAPPLMSFLQALLCTASGVVGCLLIVMGTVSS